MLIGEYKHTIDLKGRLFMPAKFRDDLGEKFVISRGTARMLFVFSQESWANYLSVLRERAIGDYEMVAFIRLLQSSASECETDKQGRFVLNTRLRNLAGVENDAVFIGNGNKVEIWNTQDWEKYKTENESISSKKFEEIAYKAELIGI